MDPGLLTPIDVYCERTSDAFWAEPLNAWTNVAFLLAATGLLPRLWAVEGTAAGRRLAGPARVLLVELVAIGLCSFAFHTFATPLAGAADVGSIALFIATFVAVYQTRVLGVGRGWATLATVGLFVAAGTLPGVPQSMVPNFVLAYTPPAVAALGLGVATRARGKPGGWCLVAASGVFTVSMFVAALDQPLCAWWPYGTHFIWHVLNAITLYLAVRGFLASAWPDAADAPVPRNVDAVS